MVPEFRFHLPPSPFSPNETVRRSEFQMMLKSANTQTRRRLERQLIEDGTAIWKTKKEIDAIVAAEEKKEQWIMLATYNPWGKPGHGAPMPGALRKTKWTLDAPNNEIDPSSAIALGRPGHGAPLRTPSGNTKAYIKADPLIRFQSHDSSRRAIENDLRYRLTPNEKENYRQELDEIICQKKKKKGEEAVPGTPSNKQQKGWTSDKMFNQFERDLRSRQEREQVYEITGGGVELVPLLAKHRITRCPLSTTDVTRMSRISNELPKLRATDYFRQLCSQIDERERQKKQEQKEDIEDSQRHFETWKGFWGRPGHGAPKALSQREKLDILLYRIPARQTTTFSAKS